MKLEIHINRLIKIDLLYFFANKDLEDILLTESWFKKDLNRSITWLEDLKPGILLTLNKAMKISLIWIR